MGFEVRMTGNAELHEIRQRLKKFGDTGLGKEMDKGFRTAVKPLGPAIRAEAETAMPSGYGPLLSRSLQFKLSSRTAKQRAELRFRVYADGKREHRDIPATNKGVLRHPVFGRRRRAWVAQRVKAGFVDKPAEQLLPNVRREMDAVLDQVSKKLGKG